MCGIAGWIDHTPCGGRAPLERMLHAMIARGPDDCGVAELAMHAGGRVLLGARRLAILDLSRAAAQPMQDRETGNVIVYNGEIYNFAELRAELQGRGCGFRSQGDTEVILAGYRIWGEAVIERLRGMFAIALWDQRRQSLLLARDRLGIKPLFYGRTAEGGLVFASQLRALAASGLIGRELDPTGLDSLLQFGSVQEPATILRGVRQLAAGHVLRREHGENAPTLRRYWALPVSEAQPNGASTRNGAVNSREDVVARLRAQLDEVSRLHLASDAPLGAFLSGGLDSGAVAALAAREKSSLATFCITFPDQQPTEGDAARRTAEHIRCRHQEVTLTSEEVRSAVPEAVGALDQPTIAGVNTWFIARAAPQAGLKAMLSGVGGDELFAGYRSFRDVPRMERAENFPRWSRALAGSMLDSRFFPSRAARVAAWLRERDGFGHPFFATRMIFPPAQAAELLQADWILAIDHSVFADTAAEYRRLLASPDAVSRISALELSLYLRNTVLRDTDCASMAHSLEVRAPLLDHVLVESVMRLPGRFKLNGGSNKPLLAAAMGGALPAETLARPKRAFNLPWEAWLRGSLRDEVEQSLREPAPALTAALHWPRVEELWRGFMAGRVHWSRAWLFHVLNQWCQRHLA